MLGTLKEILDSGFIDHADGYEWKGTIYLQLFMVGEKCCVWGRAEKPTRFRL
jgi:hypothetical protein